MENKDGRRKCTNCGIIFILTDTEKVYYDRQHLNYPELCRDCREYKRNGQSQQPPIPPTLIKDKKPAKVKSVYVILALLVITLTYVLIQRGMISDRNEKLSNVDSVVANHIESPNLVNQGDETNTSELIEVIPTLISEGDDSITEETLIVEDANPPKDNSIPSITEAIISPTETLPTVTVYTFRSPELLQEHFEKHGSEFGYESSAQYEQGADTVIHSPNVLQKVEKEDGDYVYYLEATNEFVILSLDGYIRTYFKPEDGIEYYNKQ